MPDKKCLKAINFDLDTKALQKHYPSSNWRKAYDDIKVFLFENGFEHRQGSGYVSKNKLHNTELSLKIEALSIAMPWLSKCVKQFDVTNVGKQYSMLETIIDAVQEMDIDSVELSNKSEYIAKLEDIEQIADKIAAAINNGDLDKEQSKVQER